MITIPSLNIEEFLLCRETTPIVDVRTPAEFAIGHVEGAVNIPLFSNDERAEIGTLYKQKSKEQAVMRGLEIVGPKMATLTKMAKDVSKNKQLLVYCWRGGMRSYAFAWMLKMYGLEVSKLEGGYQSYRRHLKLSMKRAAQFVVLGGLTGSGKTELLQALSAEGEQVIDLEKLANHKGSAFGQIGEHEQHHNEFFENLLGEEFLTMDLRRVIWVEDEGKCIGKNFVPDEIFLQMRLAPVVFVDVPHQERITRLVEMYAQAGREELIASVGKIRKRLGGQHAKAAIEFIEQGNLAAAAGILLIYYDKSYMHALSDRNAQIISRVDFTGLDLNMRVALLKKSALSFFTNSRV